MWNDISAIHLPVAAAQSVSQIVAIQRQHMDAVGTRQIAVTVVVFAILVLAITPSTPWLDVKVTVNNVVPRCFLQTVLYGCIGNGGPSFAISETKESTSPVLTAINLCFLTLKAAVEQTILYVCMGSAADEAAN